MNWLWFDMRFLGWAFFRLLAFATVAGNAFDKSLSSLIGSGKPMISQQAVLDCKKSKKDESILHNATTIFT